MTNRLYYDNAYLTAFDAIVVDALPGRIALSQSAFYPTSGGQPFDTGIIRWENGEVHVTDVTVDNDTVWHHVDAQIPVGANVHGEINWARRFDHMQQHAGDHMIAGAVWELFRGVTIGLHTGSDVSSIDIAMEEGKTHLTEEEIRRLEDSVNRRIQQNHPIRCWFPDADELESLPLRKKPTVSEHVRIVAMGDFEMVACGGTHPDTTGQIGLVKILSTLPARGKMRLTFVAGMRAVHAFQASYQAVRSMGAMLSADTETAPAALQKLMDTQMAQQKEMNQKLSLAAIETIIHSLEIRKEAHVYCCHLPFADASILQQAAKALLQKENTLLFLSCPRPAGCHVLFARSADRREDMASLLRSCNIRGGGKPDFVQGSSEKPVSPALLDSLL
ncbi:MAG: alanyl-tRNA editing protein [Clostridia bacterium]|nr:alanyl-tRNA editing protein [Clostridia bacterium]